MKKRWLTVHSIDLGILVISGLLAIFNQMVLGNIKTDLWPFQITMILGLVCSICYKLKSLKSIDLSQKHASSYMKMTKLFSIPAEVFLIVFLVHF